MNRIIYLFLMLIINSQLLADFVKPAEIEIIASHFSFTEGPACDQQGNLYFSDLKERRIYKISANGKKSIFLDIKLKTNGLMFHRNGMLYACVTHPDAKRKIGSLISINPENKRITTIASTYKGKAFNRLNDLVIDKSGGVYFTDIIPGKKGRGQKKAGIY
ncbi:MAG: SMP-30/gluconolactonase/LRE family protein [Lentisphaeraceae bacterium]|nr:SMP-30/gluconolactonase/LRE family protein [Lentisphaeraceae bacterium]